MEKIITYETLSSFCHSNDKEINGEIKGIAISFSGLNHTKMGPESEEFAKRSAEKGIINISPYENPWAWMNRQAISFVDEIVDVLFEKYGLKENLPIVTMGGSMGGLSSLVYTRYAKRQPVLCATLCPVCDLPYHYTERPDLPRTLYSAFGNEDGKMEDILKKYSPYHLAKEMPDIDYILFLCDEDKAVNMQSHGEKFISRMKEENKSIKKYVLHGFDHCQIDHDHKEIWFEAIFDKIEK